MKLNRTIKRILFLAAWIIVGAGMTVLLVAANGKDQNIICKDLAVTIKGVGENFYIDKNDIVSLLKKESKGKLVKRKLVEIDLARLEQKLEKSSWIRDAELYFDSRNVLHVIVYEREPIARVFTTAGRSFYIDSSGMRLPLLDKVSVRVPVITNFTNARKLSAADSVVLYDLKRLTHFVNNHEFWSAQVAQIDIAGERSYEIIPTVGSHVIRIGNGDQLEEKFNRLMVFYKQVATKVGIDKYSVLDAQFDGQVIGVHKGAVSRIDSIQLQRTIKELMARSILQAEANQPMETTSNKPVEAKSAAQQHIEPKGSTNPTPTKTTPKENPVPVKTTQSKPIKTVVAKRTEAQKRPKALMSRKTAAHP